MTTVEISPIPHNILEDLYPHVFNNEFEKRKLINAIDLQHYTISDNWLLGAKITKGSFTCVEMKNSKGEIEVAHFWKMAGNRWTNYLPRYCYSFIKKAYE